MLPIALINSSLILVFFSFFVLQKETSLKPNHLLYTAGSLDPIQRQKKLALHPTGVWNDAFVTGHTSMRGPRGRPVDVRGMHSFNMPLHKNSITDANFKLGQVSACQTCTKLVSQWSWTGVVCWSLVEFRKY